MKILGLLCFLALLLYTTTATAETSKKSSGKMATEIYGYLSDNACWGNKDGIAVDGANLKTNPEKHTVACLTAKGCAASGYGLLKKGADGTYTMTKFDKKGNKLAMALLKKTKKTDNYYVEVKGTESKGMLKVKAIEEAAAPAN